MTAVLLASTAVDLARNVRLAAGDDLTVIRPEQVPTGPSQLLALAAEPAAVRTVLLDVTDGQLPESLGLELAERFELQSMPVDVVLVTRRAEELGLAALRVGVRDLVSPDTGVDELRVLLRRIQTAARHRSDGTSGLSEGHAPSGRVITVASPKGGVGKTTVATNLALTLAENAPQSTVLVDLDVQFGDVAAALDLEPSNTISEMVRDGQLDDVLGLKTLLAKHPSGLQVVCGVRSPDEADHLHAPVVSRLLDALRHEYRYVIIDTAPGLSEHTLAALDITTDLVLVSGLDVPSVRGLQKELHLLDAIELPPMTRHLVVNMVDPAGGLSIADVEATVGHKIDIAVPRSHKVMLATNQGVPVVRSSPRDKAARELSALAARFQNVRASSGVTALHRGWRRR